MPLLGHDAQGRLVAQQLFDADPKALLVATGPVLPLRSWTHVAVTWSTADGVRLYVGGALAAAAAPLAPNERHRLASAAPTYLFFGTDRSANCWTTSIERGDWNGIVDELRIYDYALTPAEIEADAR
jgi:hypothetical protein